MLLAKSTDGGADVQRAGQGRRLLRPARLRHLPGRRRRPGPRLRAGEGPDAATRSSGPPTTRRARSTRRTRRRSSSPSARTSTRTPTSRTAACPAGFAADGTQHLHRRQDRRRVQQRHPAQRVDRTAARTFTGGDRPTRGTQPTVNDARRRRSTDQFWQWAAFTTSGKLAVSYYDRQYGDDETTGYSDFTLSGVARPGRASAQKRVTSLVDAAADPVRRASSSATTPGSTRSTTPTRSGRTPGRPTCSSAPAPARRATRPTSASAPRAPAPQAGLTANDEDIFTAGVEHSERLTITTSREGRLASRPSLTSLGRARGLR